LATLNISKISLVKVSLFKLNWTLNKYLKVQVGLNMTNLTLLILIKLYHYLLQLLQMLPPSMILEKLLKEMVKTLASWSSSLSSRILACSQSSTRDWALDKLFLLNLLLKPLCSKWKFKRLSMNLRVRLTPRSRSPNSKVIKLSWLWKVEKAWQLDLFSHS
jgi:hypothetical protein